MAPTRTRDSEDRDPIEGRIDRVRRRKGRRSLLIRVILTIGIVYLTFGVVFGIAVVQGDSMTPALKDGDFALFLRVGATYHAGDIVLVDLDGEMEYVKRIVALPGQTVDIRETTGELLVDGEPLLEPYIYEGTYRKDGIEYPLTLGSDEYFVLGDHRGNSRDSRTFGPVREEQLDGRLLFLLFRWQG